MTKNRTVYNVTQVPVFDKSGTPENITALLEAGAELNARMNMKLPNHLELFELRSITDHFKR